MSSIAYAYSRYSSARQGSGDSVRRQLSACIEFANKHNLTLDTSLRDHGVSGYKGVNRIKGALGSFIARVERGEIARGSYFLVDSLDRFSREQETIVIGELIRLSLAGIRIVNISEEHILPERPDMVDWIRLLVHAARAHSESKEKGRKVREAHTRSKERARQEGRVWHRGGPTWLSYDDVTQRWKETARAEIVRRIFREADSGLGASTIARRLNEEGVPTPKHGQGWHHSTVLEILRNRAVIGEYQPCRVEGSTRVADGDPIQGYYPEIITAETFARVRMSIDARNKRPGHGGGRRGVQWANLLHGLGECSACGGRMGLARSGKLQGAVLRCGNAARGHGCQNRTRYPYEKIEAALLSSVRDIDLPQHYHEQPKVSSATKLRDLQERMERLLDLAETQTGSAIKDRVSKLQAQIDEISQKVDSERLLPRRTAQAQSDVRELIQAAQQAGNAELRDVRERMHERLKTIVTKATFRPALPTPRGYNRPVELKNCIVLEILSGAKFYIYNGASFSGFDLRHPRRAVPKRWSGGDPSRENLVSSLPPLP